MNDRTADRIKLALSLLYCGIALLYAFAAAYRGQVGYLLPCALWVGLAYSVSPQADPSEEE